MSNVQGVSIIKEEGALGPAQEGADRISGLIAGVAVAPSGLAFQTTAQLFSVKDAEDLGITALYDTTNSELLHWNISEFFRKSPKGKLWIRLIESDGTPLVSPSTMLTDATEIYARKLLIDAGGEIRQVAVMVNKNHLAGTYVGGIPTEVSAAISVAQTFAAWAYTTHKPCQVILEGCDVQTPLSSLANLRSFGSENPKVSICIGADYDKNLALSGWNKRASALGTCLGMVSLRKVDENIGWVQEGNIQDAGVSRFVKAALSNGVAIETYEASYQAVEDKGFIFVMPYVGINGYYFNNDHTCCATTQQEESISSGRVKDKAARLLRTAYLPLVKSSQLLNPTTGKLSASSIAYLNAVGEKTLDLNMTNKLEISGRAVKVDPDSDLINAPKQLDVAFGIVKMGQIGEIEGHLTFVTNV